MTASPPSPAAAADEAAFVAALGRLKAWSGLSYRQLERRAADAGHWLPYSTASTALGRDRLPREELVVAFVRACGLDDDEAEPWVATRRRIAISAYDAQTSTTPTPTPSPVAPVSPVHSRVRLGRRWRPSVRSAAVTAVLAAIAVLGFNTEEETQVSQENSTPRHTLVAE